MNGEALVPHHTRNVVGKHAGRIDHIAHFNRFVVAKRDLVAVFRFFNGRHRRVDENLRAVRLRVFRAGDRHLIGAADAAGRRPQRGRHIRRKLRFQFARPRARNQFHARHAVFQAAVIELLQLLFLFLVKRDDQRTAPLQRHLELRRPFVVHRIAAHVQKRHQRPRRRVVPGMDDRAIRAGSAHRHVLSCLGQRHLQLFARKLAQNRAARHAAADYKHIIQHLLSSPIFGMQKAKTTKPFCRACVLALSISALTETIVAFFAPVVNSFRHFLPMRPRFFPPVRR